MPMLSVFLFGLVFCVVSILTHLSKRQIKRDSKLKILYPAYHLACLLEDAPASSLKGQAYELATPLMTPLACIVPYTWHHFYKQHLGKPGVNYWQWRDKPESRNVCQELSNLFELPVPQGYVKEVLEALAREKPPYWQSNFKQKYQGKFAEMDFRLQNQIRLGFKQWHNKAKNQIGVDALKSIYEVCYSTSWPQIQELIDDKNSSIIKIIIDPSIPWWKVLEVYRKTSPVEVEKAYKSLIRIWHPDLNNHPNATEVTARVNMAYEQYQSSQKESKEINDNLWLKIRDWLSK